MVGHRSPRYVRFGWASARADDALNWLTARAGALGVILLRPHRGLTSWSASPGKQKVGGDAHSTVSARFPGTTNLAARRVHAEP
jgi:cobalamin biosynthesis protein CobD/CbiB